MYIGPWLNKKGIEMHLKVNDSFRLVLEQFKVRNYSRFDGGFWLILFGISQLPGP
jgi:hypothetical protein